MKSRLSYSLATTKDESMLIEEYAGRNGYTAYPVMLDKEKWDIDPINVINDQYPNHNDPKSEYSEIHLKEVNNFIVLMNNSTSKLYYFMGA